MNANGRELHTNGREYNQDYSRKLALDSRKFAFNAFDSLSESFTGDKT
jgi:hypothetical protein